MDLNLIKQIRVFGSSINILYVEDEENIRNQISKMLKQLFNSVEVASNGVEALEMYKDNSYDLVITDLKMPLMDGIELCESIISINRDQLIILISAHKEIDELLQLINLGIAGFLLKPIDMDVMLHKLFSIVKNVYADKIMKYHYDEMKKQISQSSTMSEDEFNNKDALTSLYNHKYFMECISGSDDVRYAILVNINDFKLINDYYSFAHGNHLLYQIANILEIEALNYGCDVFRISSDEFILLKKEPPINCDVLKEGAKSICKLLEKRRFSVIGINDISITITLGIAKSQHRLLECLHQSLQYAKKHGLKYAFYKDVPDSTSSVKNIIEVKKMLQNSIENCLITPVYQPILMKNKNIKYEVLMRIKNINDANRLIEPGLFLDIAKKHSYYNEISQMVIFQAIDIMLQNDEVFSLNFSYADMNNTDLMNKLEDVIFVNGLGNRLIFEIVETEQLDNMDIVNSFIERFRVHGVKIAIDDFGSGYSNFAYIFTLQPDFIKIDGSLISQILDNEKIHVLVETIIEFAHKLNVEVIAEHVSSKELHDALLKLNIDAMQGYFIGHPNENI
ncbi:MAG: EAL domain-containing protein [Sulfurimonas sp.]|jgi:diguanylate cyclase (GGDEF)-like protein|uniref:EAL domain-containing protein n=1 Tax=Sulfurimonas sp. TaxID=2022749 RepID=UPI001BBB5173|nr:EAL domain-containing protein [Sulfurimonas sp.]